VAEEKERERKYGVIRQDPRTGWDKAKEFLWELVPFQQHMTEAGRQLLAGDPAEAQAQQNQMAFMQVLDLMIGGETGAAFFGRGIVQRANKKIFADAVMEKVGEQLSRRIPHHPPPLGPGMRTGPTAATAMRKAVPHVPERFQQEMLTVLERARTMAAEGDIIKELRRADPMVWESPVVRKFFERGAKKDIVKFHSGIPADKESLREAAQTINDIYKKYWWKPPPTGDMKWYQNITSLPHWVAKKFPAVKQLYNIQRAREQARSDFLYEMIEKADPFFRLKGKDYDVVKRLLIQGDEVGHVFTRSELADAGASNQAIEAYEAVRKTLDDVLKDYWNRMKQAGIPDDEIAQYRQQIGRNVGYFPRIRKGKYYIKATKEGEPATRIHFNSKMKGASIRNRLLREGYTITDQGAVSRLPEEVYFQISPEAISQVTEYALSLIHI
jgi:hypothetical protein